MKRRLTFANVTAALALFLALTAGSYAAAVLPKNSVTSKQVKDHSLLKKDFRSGQLPRGARGPAGATGAQGPQGPQGAQGPVGPVSTSTLTRVDGPSVPIGNSSSADGGVELSSAVCPAGMKAVTGGIDVFTGNTAGLSSQASTDRTSWFVVAANASTYTGGHVKAIAYCAGSGQAVTARHSVRKLNRSTRREARALLQRARAEIAKTRAR